MFEAETNGSSSAKCCCIVVRPQIQASPSSFAPVASYSPSAMRIECVGVDSSVHGREHVADDIGFHQLLPSAQGIPAIDRDRLTDDKA